VKEVDIKSITGKEKLGDWSGKSVAVVMRETVVKYARTKKGGIFGVCGR
jgi:ribosomal protein L7Ae-like RNA K-turn-binding protein